MKNNNFFIKKNINKNPEKLKKTRFSVSLGGHNLKKKLLIILVVIGVTLILLNNFSHANFTYKKDVPFARGKINYKHPDLKVMAMNIEDGSGNYKETTDMPDASDYTINSNKSYCTLNGVKQDGVVLKTINNHHVIEKLKKNSRCYLYFDKLESVKAVLANNYIQDNLSKVNIESIVTLDKINIPDDALKSWDASEAKDQSVMAYYTDTDGNGKYELFLAANGGVVAPKDSSYLFSDITNSIFNPKRFKNVKSIDLSKLDTSEVTNMNSIFAGLESLTSINITNFDTSNVTTMEYMFQGMTSLTSLDVSKLKTSKVVNMHGMFWGVSKITSLDISNFDTRNVTDMGSMFGYTNSITSLDLNNFVTSNVTDMSSMFYGMKSLTSLNLSSFNTSKVTNMNSMFYGMESLTSLNLINFDTSNVTNMKLMFSATKNITSLNVSSFNTSKVTNTSYMFEGMESLTSLNLSNFDTSNVTDISYMICGLSSLINLDLSKANFNKVTNNSWMLMNSTKLKSIKVKDATAKTYMESRVSDASLTGVTVSVVS